MPHGVERPAGKASKTSMSNLRLAKVESIESDIRDEDNQTTMPPVQLNSWKETSPQGSKTILPFSAKTNKVSKLGQDLEKADMMYKPQNLAQKYADDLLRFSNSNNLDLMVIFKSLLGTYIREMSAGEYFGERALDGMTLRTASIVALDDCHMLTLTADEYNGFVKIRHKLLRDMKHNLLTEKFRGYSSLPSEELWKFQYLFQVCHTNTDQEGSHRSGIGRRAKCQLPRRPAVDRPGVDHQVGHVYH